MSTLTSFWHTNTRPFLGLSPMDGITDHPFRFIQKKYGNPDLVYTEFTSVEGLCHGAERLLKDFLFDETQRPIIGQIYGTTPEYFRQAAIILCELGYDGIDINMGCPAKNVAHSGAGAGLIRTPQLAQQIIVATKQGVLDYLNGQRTKDCPDIKPSMAAEVARRHNALPTWAQAPRELPVSVKTRVGYDRKQIDEWLPFLLEKEPAAVTIHGRTLKQQYGGLADWDQIGLARQMRDQIGSTARILGNGDIKTLATAHERIATYGLDGVLVGRATMGDPKFFGQAAPAEQQTSVFAIALEHAQLFEEIFNTPGNEYYNFLPMRKHLGWYVREVPNASQIRIELFKTNSSVEVEAVLREHNVL